MDTTTPTTLTASDLAKVVNDAKRHLKGMQAVDALLQVAEQAAQILQTAEEARALADQALEERNALIGNHKLALAVTAEQCAKIETDAATAHAALEAERRATIEALNAQIEELTAKAESLLEQQANAEQTIAQMRSQAASILGA